MANTVRGWSLTCPQRIGCLLLHVSAFCAWAACLLLVGQDNVSTLWPDEQRDYQIALRVWGVLNADLQISFLGLLFFLQMFFQTAQSLCNIIVIIGFLWALLNLNALLFYSIFFADKIAIGSEDVRIVSITLFTYLVFLVCVLMVIIYVYVWPAPCNRTTRRRRSSAVNVV